MKATSWPTCSEPLLDHRAADEQQHRLAHDADPLGGRAVLRVDLRGVVVGVAVLADHVAVVEHVVAGAVEAGDDAHAREALGHVAQHPGDAVADAQVAAVGSRPEPEREPEQQRHDHEQGDQRELDVHDEQDHGDDHHREPLQEELHEAVLQQLLQRLDVTHDAGHDHARLLVGVVVEREALQVCEHAHPELEHHAGRDATRDADPEPARHRGDHDRDHGRDRAGEDHRPVVLLDAVVDADRRRAAAPAGS